MPILDITSSTDDSRAYAMSSGRILAAMFYPDDGVGRERFQGLYEGFLALHDQPTGLAVLTALWETYGRCPERWKSGIAAACILRTIRRIAEHRPESEPSVSKAVHIVTNTVTHGFMGRSKLREAWSTYKSVSHLWATTGLDLPAKYASPKIKPDGGISFSDRVKYAFMSIISAPQLTIGAAEEWRRFGQNFTTRQGSPLFLPGEAWAAPAEYKSIKVYPVLPPLNDVENTALDDYKAPTPYQSKNI